MSKRKTARPGVHEIIPAVRSCLTVIFVIQKHVGPFMQKTASKQHAIKISPMVVLIFSSNGNEVFVTVMRDFLCCLLTGIKTTSRSG